MAYPDRIRLIPGWDRDLENRSRAVAAIYAGIEIGFTVLVDPLEDGSLPIILMLWHGRGALALVLQERDE